MTNTNIRRLVYHIRHNYVTMNNLVVLVAFLIAASWAWGSIGVLQKNYALQKVVDEKRARAKLIELQAETLVYEQKYYRSTEYQELAVRERMGLALPGERVLILPPNSDVAKSKSQAVALGESSSKNSIEPDNLQQWVNFLFGGNRKHI